MKSKLLALALGFACSASALAGPAITLPGGPLYLKFNGNEQIGLPITDAQGNPTNSNFNTWGSNASVAAGGNAGSSLAAQAADVALNASHGQEINWGVFTMSTISVGAVNAPHDTISQSAPIIFVDGLGGGQVTGMFYDVKSGTASAGNPFPATGGIIDLYWRDLSTQSFTNNSLNDEKVRCGYNCATGYTQGTFLARLNFATGIDTTAGGSGNTISGTSIPASAGFAGVATSYATVDLAAGGLWATKLDSDWFNTAFGTRDLRFRNNYEQNALWNGDAASGVVGAKLDDPGQAFALPEPGALSLMGLALVGMGAIRRRKQK